MNKNRKVSNYLIDRDFQLKFLFVFAGLGALQAFIFIFGSLTIFDQLLSVIENSPAADDQNLMLALHQTFTYAVVVFILLLVFGSILFLVFGFRYTHKVAGALYKMKKSFKEMDEEGILKEIHLREGDFFRETVEAFNDMVKKLHNK